MEPQITLLCQHLREYGHWNDTCALTVHRGIHAPDSRFNVAGGPFSVNTLDTMVADLVGLLFSGRVSFSVGNRQGPVPPRNEYGFVIYANIAGHNVLNLAPISGQHRVGGATNYLRIVFRFMDRIRAELDTLGVRDQQLNIVTMFPENPASAALANSILPAGVGGAPGLMPRGVAIGGVPMAGGVDNRVPRVIAVRHWYHVFAFWNWF